MFALLYIQSKNNPFYFSLNNWQASIFSINVLCTIFLVSQPPRGPIPDPRFTNGVLSPGAAPQQSDPRYGGADPRYGGVDPRDPRHEPQFGGKPRRTNSVPNMKQMQAKMQQREREPQYDPRYEAQRQPEPQSNNHTGSLPRQSKQKHRPQSQELPQFIPIQYATGKYQRQPSYPTTDRGGSYPTNDRGGHNPYPADYHKQHLNNNYPSTANRYSQQYPPPNKGYTNGYHNGYPADPYQQRPGVGVVYNPDLGVSDF